MRLRVRPAEQSAAPDSYMTRDGDLCLYTGERYLFVTPCDGTLQDSTQDHHERNWDPETCIATRGHTLEITLP